MIFIYILSGIVIIILAAIVYVGIKIMKERRINTEEENENYGAASDFEQYYEDEKNAKIVDKNDYY